MAIKLQLLNLHFELFTTLQLISVISSSGLPYF